jgi:uncharacterized membrane protein
MNAFKAELLIAHVLRYGVLLCLFVIGAGLALKLGIDHSSEEVIRALVGGLQVGDYRPPAHAAAFLQGNPDTIIALGLVLLIALPVIRVALTTAIFFYEKDWAFFAITLFVLTVLLSGVFLGRAF